MKGFSIALIITAELLCRAAAQGVYDEKPLRGNLSDLPFAQTGLGREAHRFANAEVNRYRIYDYYQRQAQWHIEQAKNPAAQETLLLPFTGLDGGRRGHWGVTNEVSIQSLKREKPPILPSMLSRGEYGLEYMTFPANECVIVYDLRLPGICRVLTSARLISPPGPFRGAVDCWGFTIQAEGKEWLQTIQPEWSAGSQTIAFKSYHTNAGEIAYRHEVGTSAFLEQISLDGKADDLVVIRRFAFAEGMPEMRFNPQGAGIVKKVADGFYLAPGQDGGCQHLLQFGGGLKLSLDTNGKTFVLHAATRNAWMEVRTWKGKQDAQALARINRIPARDPLQTIQQKKPSFPQTIITQGHLNADPAAAKGAYEIDDINLPMENPWNQPLTLSGIDFDENGIAYVCTMVGDVWRIEGLDNELKQVKWRRFASGLNLPMGLVVVDGVPHVSCRKQIIKLHDQNADLEADEYEQFNRVELPLSAENGGDLRCDADGNFYRNGGVGIFSISADGKQVKQVGDGSRNPLGLAVRNDGLVLSDSSEGENYNGACTVFESMHPENTHSSSKKRRILYLPRGIDSSPGSRIFINDPRFGPLGHSILGLSYGTGTWYSMLRDENEGTPQAALCPMPGEFASGALRLAKNPRDGQIYCVGLDGWGDYAVQEGCFHRIRYSRKKSLVVSDWQAHRNGLLIHFHEPVDPASLQREKFFAQQWNTVDYQITYGSADYSARSPQEIGHDRLQITRIIPQQDPRVVFFEIPDLLPAMYTQLHGSVLDPSGQSFTLDFYATINRLRADFAGAVASDAEKPDTLVVREEEQNGNTYEVVSGFFDKKVGRDAIKRPIANKIPWTAEQLDYEWVRSNVIEQKCIICHQAGTPHDLSTYEKLSAKIVPGNPNKSHLIGMLKTSTMPPYPLPLLDPSTIEALEQWIKMGAPKERKN